jgi:putative membrane protein
MQPPSRRSPALEPAWRREGSDPDYRFTLANERTFLAWIRTALALVAAGVLLDQFATKLKPAGAVLVLAVLLCLGAAMLCLVAYFRWRGNEIAMRHARPLPPPAVIPIFALCGVTMASAVGVLLWLR